MQLANHEVHIYVASLTPVPDLQPTYFNLLNSDERERAARLISPRHQQRFITAHGILRKLLSRYLNTTPEIIEFSHGQHRKPSLQPPSLQFNISHSDNLAVYAFTRTGEIGVDIEKIQVDQKLDVAERFFSPSEILALTSQAATEQAATFYRLWSRKEAIIKANGRGLSQPLASFSVAATDTVETLVLEDGKWTLYPLAADPDYAGAIASALPVDHITIWDYQEPKPTLRTRYNPMTLRE